MANKLIINGLDLSEMGISDVPNMVSRHERELTMAEHFARQILGSITFGPLVIDYDADVVDDIWDDDEEWGLAE